MTALPSDGVTGRGTNARRIRRGLWILALLACLTVSFKVLAGDVYHVTSHSMEPTIEGVLEALDASPSPGERVLVLYGRPRSPRRFDLVVVEQEGERAPAVKRVLGLPGESVRIDDGDVLIDGRRRAARDPRPGLVELFDGSHQAWDEFFRSSGDVSTNADSLELRADAEPARLEWRRRLTDGFRSRAGTLVSGDQEVGDAALALECSVLSAPAALALILSERGDRFRLVLRCAQAGQAEIRIERQRGEDAEVEVVFQSPSFTWEQGQWMRLEFANLDNTLDARWGAAGTSPRADADVSYSANTELPAGPEPALQHLLPRVGCHVTAGGFALRKLRVMRDFHYTSRGRFAVSSALVLGPDEVFLLGDHSSHSVDGRDFGPTRLGKIIGQPWRVVWPLRSARALRPLARSGR